MEFQKQVDKQTYEFARYMSKERWASMWHQLDEVQKLKPESVLEIGPGPGLFKTLAASFGLSVQTLDLDPDLNPDHVGSATEMPFRDATYDVVCAFQMLEHLPYDYALKAFGEMVRVSRANIVISLPDARQALQYKVYLPKLGTKSLLVPRPMTRAKLHAFDGEHHWELNKRNYSLNRVIRDLSTRARLLKTFRVFENPTHRFFVFEKLGDAPE